jgi:hypothetical protein
MKTFRNVAFLALFGAVVVGGPTTLHGMCNPPLPPPFYDCPEGCSCDTSTSNPTYVEMYCEDGAPADMCWLFDEACLYYCQTTLPGWVFDWCSQSVICDLTEMGGDCEPPLSLNPPTDASCTCSCYVR